LVVTFSVGSPALLGLWLRARADHALAEANRARALVERDRAERFRDRAVRAVDSLLRAEDEALQAEELRPFRKALIDAGLAHASALVRDLEGDARAEFERLLAYQSLALVQAEGGDKSAAIETIRKAISLADGLVNRDPASIRPRLALAAGLHHASILFPDEPSRRAAAERSNELLRAIPPDSTELKETESQGLAAMNRFNIGHFHFMNGRYAEATRAFEAAQAAYDRLLDGGEKSPRTRDLAGRNLLYLCRIYRLSSLARSLKAGHRAESIFRTLVQEYPDHYDFAVQLSLVEEELGNHYKDAGRWREAISAFEQTRQTLKQMAVRHGNLVSRMAVIQERIAAADVNLRDAYASDPVKYAAPRRELAAEAYEICDKLGVVQPLSWNSRIVYATASHAIADYQATDDQTPDLELLRKAERLWEGLRRDSNYGSVGEAALVVIRRRLASELAARGQAEEAARYERRSLETARGKPELLFLLAVDYAHKASLTGKLPNQLSNAQLQRRRDRYRRGALAMLRQAATEGFKDAARLKKEPAFDAIRSDPDFRAIAADVEFPAQAFFARSS
jgi:tetratricopeptide (TPR) repeat protein